MQRNFVSCLNVRNETVLGKLIEIESEGIMLYSMKKLLDHALKNNYAVMAPSIRTEDCMRAAVEAAEELSAPVIFNCNFMSWGNPGEEILKLQVDMAKRIAIDTKVPIAINLDHGRSFEECAMAVSAGMTSVMIDASTKSLEENIKITKEVVEMAHAVGITVEAEIGHVGLADTSYGVNENLSMATSWSAYTDPDEFKYFCEETQVDCVAVSIGNKHGAWAKGVQPHIEFELLGKLRYMKPDIPLVLHGGSGTGDMALARAASLGICKINVGTELEAGVIQAIMDKYGKTNRYGGVFNVAREGYKMQVLRHMKLFHSNGKAWS